MTTNSELASEVITALDNGKKISAIKTLRALRNIGLKEAKELVDVYLQTHPETQASVQKSGSNNSLVVLIILGTVAYFIYNFLIK